MIEPLRRRRLARTERSLVWLLGSQRSGSTWLLNLLCVSPDVLKIDEIGIGPHLAPFTSDVIGAPLPTETQGAELFHTARRTEDDYFFSDRYAAAWRPELRRLLLARLDAQLVDRPRARNGRSVVIVKEPVGSQAAELIMGLLPAARLLFLVRDGRDVVDSMVDAMQQGGWLSDTYGGGRAITDDERLAFVKEQAVRWVARTTAVLAAVDAHDPARCLVARYEDLLADTVGGLERIFAWLDLTVPRAAVEGQSRELALANMPAEHRGAGRFVRSASPGLWRENLRPAEQAALETIMGDTLARLGY
jgi:hypothetical protein